MKNKSLLFVSFIFSHIWLSYKSGNIVGVDAWDYMRWVDISATNGSLIHPPLHVPGFYALISLIAVYTQIDIYILYVYILPLIGAISLWYSLSLIIDNYGLFISIIIGFMVLRTSMIIPEWLGLIMIPSAIYLLIHKRENTFLLLSIITGIIFSHHLSGGIITIIIIFYTLHSYLIKTHVKSMSYILIYSLITAIFSWYIAGAFPLELIILLLKQIKLQTILFMLPIIFIMLKYNRLIYNKILNTLKMFCKKCHHLSIILTITIVILLIIIGLTTQVPINMIIFWSPIIAFIYMAFDGLANIDIQKITNNKYLIWPLSIFVLNLFISIFSVIRPLLARLFIFQIQSMLLLSSISMAMIIENTIVKKQKFRAMLLFFILLLNSFQSYPPSYSWFNTEFRYYNQEVEIASITGTYTLSNLTIDTDNRMGVMYKGITGRESSYGELNDSYLTHLLLNLTEMPYPDLIIYTQTFLNAGFMRGKFIHGKGGGGNDVSVVFTENVLKQLYLFYTKPLSNQFCSIYLL